MARMALRANNLTISNLLAHVRTPLYQNAYALMLNVALTSGLGIVYWVLAARYYSTADVGLNSAIISAMMFVSGLSVRSLISTLVRFLPTGGKASTRLAVYAYSIGTLGVAVLSPIFLMGLAIWSPNLAFMTADAGLVVWFVVAAITWSIFTLQDSVMIGLRKAVWVPVENTIYAVAKIVLLIVLAGSLPQFGLFASWTIPVLLSLVPVNLFIFLRLMPRHIEETQSQAAPIVRGQIAKYVAGDYLGSAFSLASSTLLPVIVLAQAGATANAYFYLSWLVANSLQLVTTNMTTSFTVEAAAGEEKLATFTRRIFIHIARLVVPMVLVVMVAAPFILSIFGRGYAEEGATLLRLIALSTIPNIATAVYLSVARVQRRMASIVGVQGALCILTLSLSYWLLNGYGITAVGVAMLASQTIVATFVVVTRLRPLLKKVEGPRVSPVKEAQALDA